MSRAESCGAILLQHVALAKTLLCQCLGPPPGPEKTLKLARRQGNPVRNHNSWIAVTLAGFKFKGPSPGK